jgi:short-subunit dehydrogenase
MMNFTKVYITGHSSGVGNYLLEHFLEKGLKVHGASRRLIDKQISNFSEESIDIENTKKIIDSLQRFSPDVFINNAYSKFQQTYLLAELSKIWQHTEKVILNISSNVSDFTYLELEKFAFNEYDLSKQSLDEQSKKSQFSCPNLKIINLRPGLIDTPRVKKYSAPKLNRLQITEVVETIFDLLERGIYIQEMTFSPLDQFRKNEK